MIEIIGSGSAASTSAIAMAMAERIPGDIVLINAIHRPDNAGNLQDFQGLQLGLDRALAGEKVIVWGPLSTGEMQGMETARKAKNFSMFNAIPNAAYLEYPFVPDAFVALASSLLAGEKMGNDAVIEIGKALLREQEIAVLRHDAKYHVRDGTVPALMEKAADYGFFGTPEEVLAALDSWQRSSVGLLAGHDLPGQFFDVQGTLIQEDGTLNEAVMRMIVDAQQSGAVTIWTDGDLKETSAQLRALGIDLPVVSKFDFSGAIVERAIDDKTPEEFLELYGITARSFLQV